MNFSKRKDPKKNLIISLGLNPTKLCWYILATVCPHDLELYILLSDALAKLYLEVTKI